VLALAVALPLVLVAMVVRYTITSPSSPPVASRFPRFENRTHSTEFPE
jgi:hypothetical protein